MNQSVVRMLCSRSTRCFFRIFSNSLSLIIGIIKAAITRTGIPTVVKCETAGNEALGVEARGSNIYFNSLESEVTLTPTVVNRRFTMAVKRSISRSIIEFLVIILTG